MISFIVNRSPGTILLFIFLLPAFPTYSQLTRENLTGEYALTGRHEMSSGFRFESDGTFSFYYTYGASDRFTQGSWEIHKDNILLSGEKEPGKDFELVERKKSGRGFTVQVVHDNKLLIKGVRCLFTGGGDTLRQETGQNGIAIAKMKECDKIYLIHNMFPDSPTIISPEDGSFHYVKVKPLPSLAGVVFNNTVLHPEPDGFSIMNIYLFGIEPAHFVKQQ